jgi:hypothetical protein
MGVSLSWIAVKGFNPQAVNTTLGLRPTGVKEDFPESSLSAAQLPTGFYLVIFNREELSAGTLRKFSDAFPLLYGFMEEHVMFSTVAAWESGKEIWSIVHDAQKNILDLEVKGKPPESFTKIRDRLMAQQYAEGVEEPEVDHIFDVPVEVAKELTGFRYDQDIDGINHGAFKVLERVGNGASPLKLFKKLLGK